MNPLDIQSLSSLSAEGKPKILYKGRLSENLSLGITQQMKEGKSLTQLQQILQKQEGSTPKSMKYLESAKINHTTITQHNLQSTARESLMRSQFIENKQLPQLQERTKEIISNNSSTISFLVQRNKKTLNSQSCRKMSNQNNSISQVSTFNLNSSTSHPTSNLHFESPIQPFKITQQSRSINLQTPLQFNYLSPNKEESNPSCTLRENVSSPNITSPFRAKSQNILDTGSLLQTLAWKKVQKEEGKKTKINDLAKGDSPMTLTSSSLKSRSNLFGSIKTPSKDRFVFSNTSASNESISSQKQIKKQDFFTSRLHKKGLNSSFLQKNDDNQNQVNKTIETLSHEEITKLLNSCIPANNNQSSVFRSRADLKALTKWFEKMQKQNDEENKYNIEEKRKKQLEMINASFRELCTQIKIDFYEREQFFKIVWEENIKYYRSFIEDFEQIRLKISTDADSEYNRLHDFYRQYIQSTNLQSQLAKEAKQIAENECMAAKKDLQANIQVYQQLKQELNSFKKICTFLKKKLIMVTTENKNLHERQTERAMYMKHQLIADLCKDIKLNDPGKLQLNNQALEKLTEQLKVANEQVAQVQIQTNHNNNQTEDKQSNLDEGELDGENEDDNHFVFEYQEGGDLLQDVELLNAVIVNNEQEVQKATVECQVYDDLRGLYQFDIEVQTDLSLLDTKYDAIMFDKETMDDVFDFYAYKQQMDESSVNSQTSLLLNLLKEESEQNLNTQKKQKSAKIEKIKEVNSDSEKQSRRSSQSSSSSSSSDDNKSTSNASDYDQISHFQQRQSIRRRVSVSQNLFNSNRQLSLQLESYLSSSIIQDLQGSQLGIFQDQSNQSQSMKRMSILGSRDNNPFEQKRRKQIQQKLGEILEPEKLKKVLEEAGLKVISSQSDTQLEKFLKIYQLAQFKSQELGVKLQNTTSALNNISTEFEQNKMSLLNCQNDIANKDQEIIKLQEMIKRYKDQYEATLSKEKELMKATEGQDEESKEGAQKSKHQPRIYKPSKGKPAVTAFQLGKKVNMEWEFQKQQNQGKTIIEKAKSKKMVKFHNFMTVKTLLKQITMLYNERLSQVKENSIFKDIDFGNFVYNYYSSQYGVKKIADQKFLILILSVKKYSQIVRVNTFSKFLGLSDGLLNYSTDELNKYIDVLDFVNNISQAGTSYTNAESDQKYVVPYIKAVHYISQFGDTRMKNEENAELRKDVEAMKQMDSSKIAIVDFDCYMNRLLITYRILVNRAKQYVINAFNACDLDGNKKCNFQEWCLLIRHIEPEKFDDEQLESVFEQNADIVEEGEDGAIEKNLSFDKFAVVSLEYELFSDESQDRYLEITNPAQLKDKFQRILSIWEHKKPEFQRRFISLQNIDEAQKEDWYTIIKVLDEKLEAAKNSLTNMKPLLIAYNILDKESQMLEQDNIDSLFNPIQRM